ncbi:MAG: 2-vinyl bacteriochlorophyllide hydratase [Kiloniellales bacterium]|nr:2-vinyl bacteriochlorophyllide hydratase [Kiloniellales bacterium]
MILIPDLSGTVDRCIARFDVCPWSTLAGSSTLRREPLSRRRDHILYTPEQRRRRDQSPWTLVQGVLAPLQFGIFLISLVLVLRFLATGLGFEAATASIVVKTVALYTIMITGAIWERAVFGQYLFAPAFFWEDVVSMLVIALHTAYLIVLATQILDAQGQMLLALAAYAAYVINAAQFLLKLRAARREASPGGAAFRPA